MKIPVGVVGAGTMGAGIAQQAATAGHEVVLVEIHEAALHKGQRQIEKNLQRMAEKSQLSVQQAQAAFGRIYFTDSLNALQDSRVVFEAIAEDLNIKKSLFAQVESIVDDDCILASNTSSLSINAMASGIKHPEKFLGLHFFNPVPLMPLVEHIPALATNEATLKATQELMEQWGKISVVAKDTPGFIVNRIARPYYTEALRIYEEGLADFATIDFAMTDIHGFKMGPFTLMDFIGNDVNYSVTHSVWESCYFEPRYKPSHTQRNLMAAGWMGKKSGRGFYDYGQPLPEPETHDRILLTTIANRILFMLINEAVDAWYFRVASKEDIELAMTKGVNYPKGLMQWGVELGLNHCIEGMENLYVHYKEDRYRPSPGFRKLITNNC